MNAYRYSLTRGPWLNGDEGTVLFVMLNPSTADEQQDDPTIRRCIGFAQRWGFDRLEVVNLYAFRSTDPRGLYASDDPIGPDNDAAIAVAAARSRTAIAAWGAIRHPGGDERVGDVVDFLEYYCGPISCLGQTLAGHPRHPLYVPGDTPRTPFTWQGVTA